MDLQSQSCFPLAPIVNLDLLQAVCCLHPYLSKSNKQFLPQKLKWENFAKIDTLVKRNLLLLHFFMVCWGLKFPRSLSLPYWLWWLASISFLHHIWLQSCMPLPHNVHPNLWWLNLILKYDGVFQVVFSNYYNIKWCCCQLKLVFMREKENVKSSYLYIWNLFAKSISHYLSTFQFHWPCLRLVLCLTFVLNCSYSFSTKDTMN